MKDDEFMGVLACLAGERQTWQVPEIAERFGLSHSGFRNRMKAMAGRRLFVEHPASGCVGEWVFNGLVLVITPAPSDHKASRADCVSMRVLAWLESQPEGAQIDYVSAELLSPPIPAKQARIAIAHLCRARGPVLRVFRPPVAMLTLPSGRVLFHPTRARAQHQAGPLAAAPVSALPGRVAALVQPAPPSMTPEQSLDADAFLRAVADAAGMAPFTPPPAGELSIRIDAVARDVACPRPILVRQLLALGLDALRDDMAAHQAVVRP